MPPPDPDPLLVFVEPLERSGIPYMVTGSVAVLFYGEPRLTHDVDLVLHLKAAGIEAFLGLFPEERFYRPPAEVLRVELSRKNRAHFNLIEHRSGLKADCYPFVGDPLEAWGLQNRRRIELPGGPSLWLAPPEYVILRKLQFHAEGGSEKHLRDIEGMLASGLALERKTIAREAAAFGLLKTWARLAGPEVSETNP